MSQTGDAFATLQRRFLVALVVLVLVSLWPISKAAANDDWASVGLLVALDIAMVVVWLVGERKRAASTVGSDADAHGEQDQAH